MSSYTWSNQLTAVETHNRAFDYEQALREDRSWALDEGGLQFEGRSRIQFALRRFSADLARLRVAYAICGGMALFAMATGE